MIQPPANIVGHLAPTDRERSQARKKWIDDARKKGAGCQEIADALGISLHTVYGICRAKWKKGRSNRNDMFSDAKMMGFLSPETKRWLKKECPKDVPMEQFVASIVTDAHQEETDGS